MADLWIDVTNLPADTGREFSFSDQDIWSGPWAEYGLDYTVVEPFKAEMTVLPQKTGCLVTGSLSGAVRTPCSRCSEAVDIKVAARFDTFAQDESQGEDADEFLLRRERGRIELNVGALLWEEFLLAMPDKPLCREDCQGLCSVCGKNLNEGDCGCTRQDVDPRLAALHDIKIH